MKQIEESGYKYLGIIQDSEIKIRVMKDENRIFEESKEVSKIGIVCTKCVYGDKQVSVRCGGIVDWTRGNLELLDRKIRKILACNVCFIHVLMLLGRT